MDKKVVIQIVTYNAVDKVRGCLKSLEWIKDETNINLVVFDNASSEPVTDIARNEFPFAEIIANDKNTGFAGGHNLALKYSLKHSPDFLLVLNPDTTIDKAALLKMIEKFSLDKSIGLVGPLIKDDSGEIEKSINVQLNIWNYIFKIFSINIAELKTRNKYSHDNFVEAVTGACMLISIDTIKAIGLFDTDFFFYVEDTEYCYRILKSGRKILFTPEAVITHSLNCSTSSHVDPQLWRKTQLYFSTFTYFRKCRSGFEFHLLKLIRILEMAIRIIFQLNREWAVNMIKDIKKLKI